jgi:hypothetical protein
MPRHAAPRQEHQIIVYVEAAPEGVELGLGDSEGGRHGPAQ